MSLDRKVLAQDVAQYEQGNTALAEKRKKEEEQYQKDLAEYNKQKAEYDKQQKEIELAKKVEVEEDAKLSKQDLEAKRAITSAKTEEQYRDAVWNYRDTNYGGKIFLKLANKQTLAALAERERLNDNNADGSKMNTLVSKALHHFKGGTAAEWNAIIAKAKQDRRTSQMQSAGLRASGNAQIQAGIQKERERLANFTLVSPNIPQTKTTAVATGTVAEKAQDFGIGFTEATKQFGFIGTKDTVSEPKRILTAEEQKAKAMGAFGIGITSPVGIEKNISNNLLPPTRTGTGTQRDPYKSQQPDKSLLSNYLKQPQGPQQVKYEVTTDGHRRLFKSKESAEKFISRTEKTETNKVFLPAGSLQYLIETNQIASKKISNEPQGPPRPRPLESAIQFTGDIGKKYKDIQPFAFTAGAVEEGLGIVGSTINLIEEGKRRLGDFAPVKYPIKEIKKPYTLPASPIEYPFGIAVPVIFEGKTFTESERAARARQVQIIKDEGGYRYAGKLGVAIATTVPITGALKLGSFVSKAIKPKKMIGKAPEIKDVKPFQYDIAYRPTRRANEISYDDFGETVGPYSKIIKRPIAARQSNVRLFAPKKTKPIQPDITYKPARRANEIDFSDRGEIIGPYSKLSDKPIAARQSDVKPYIPQKEKPVELDKMYKPVRRVNEIDLSDRGEVIGPFSDISSRPVPARQKDVRLFIPRKPTPVKFDPSYKPRGRYEGGFKDLLEGEIPKEQKTFSKTRIGLGQGAVKTPGLKGKQPKDVELEFGYKPSKRANEIDYTDAADEIKMPKIEGLKSEVELDLKRELKRLKRTQPEFKRDEIKFKGTGGEMTSRNLILIQKSEQLTKKKLQTKRQSPVNINWSEKVETADIPKTGAAPIQVLIPQIREQKKKLQSTQQTEQIQYEEYVRSQRPTTDTIRRTIQASVITPRYSTKLQVPQRLETPQRVRQNIFYNYRQKSAERLDQPQKFSQPSLPKTPVKLITPSKLKQPTRQVYATEEPRPPRRLLIAGIPTDKPKKRSPILSEPGEKADFLGNVSEQQIEGIFGKRSETVYGQKKISRLLKGDVRVVSGKKRTVRKTTLKWKEGKKGDVFGFKYEKKKKTKIF